MRRPLSEFHVGGELEGIVRVGLAKWTEDRGAMLMFLIFRYLWVVVLFQLLQLEKDTNFFMNPKRAFHLHW